MKRITSTVFLFGFLMLFTNAQDNPPIWKFAESSTSATISLMQTDSLGFSYVAGTFSTSYFRIGDHSTPGNTSADALSTFIIKLNPVGKPVWLHSAYGEISGAMIRPEKLEISNRGEVALVISAEQAPIVNTGGVTLETGTLAKVPIICKISKTGRQVWNHLLNAQPDTSASIVLNDLFIDEMGEVFAAGYFNGSRAIIGPRQITGTPGDDLGFILNIDFDGSIDWFRGTLYNPDTDNGSLRALRITAGIDDHFYIAGTHLGARTFYFGPDSIFNSASVNCFIAKYNNEGIAQWALPLVGSGEIHPEDIKLIGNDDILLLGITNDSLLSISGKEYPNPGGQHAIFMARYASDKSYVGSTLLNTELPGLKNLKPNAYVGVDFMGNILLCSEFYASSIFSDLNALVNLYPGSSDIMAAKLDGISMDPIWTFQGSGPDNNYIESVNIDIRGNMYLGGTSYTSMLVSPEDIPVNPEGVPYVAKINNDGDLNYLYWQENATDKRIQVQAISSDAFGNAYIGGNYQGTSSNIDGINLTGMDTQGVFIGKYAHTVNLGGQVSDQDGNTFSDGYVKILGYTLFRRAPLNDSVPIQNNGSYIFNQVPYGNYLLQVVPGESSREEFIASYFPSEEYWEQAHKIRLTSASSENQFNLTIKSRPAFTGKGKANGNISEDIENIDQRWTGWDKGRPSKKAKVVLAGNKKQQKSTYEVVATVETDEDGNFVFYNLEDGDYFLWVDIPGLPCEPVHYVEVVGGTYVSNIDYLITEEMITALGTPSSTGIPDLLDPEVFQLYPNPANEFVIISIEDMLSGTLDIYNAAGAHIIRVSLDSESSQIDLTSLNPGNYLFRIMYGDSYIFKKISIL